MLRFCYLIINSRVGIGRLRDRFCMCNKFSLFIITWEASFRRSSGNGEMVRCRIPIRNWLIEGFKYYIRSTTRRNRNQASRCRTMRIENISMNLCTTIIDSSGVELMNKNENEISMYNVYTLTVSPLDSISDPISIFSLSFYPSFCEARLTRRAPSRKCFRFADNFNYEWSNLSFIVGGRLMGESNMHEARENSRLSLYFFPKKVFKLKFVDCE